MGRVLIVDDDDDVRQMLVTLFRHEGCDVSEAASGPAAMREYWHALEQESPFKLIIMDLAMPGMDGAKVAGRIRGAEANFEGAPRAFIYGYTGHGEHLHSPESMTRAGFDFVAVKPGDPAEFKRMAREVKDGRSEGR